MKNVFLITLLLAACSIHAQNFIRTYGANDEAGSKVIPAIDGGYIMAGSTKFNGPPGAISDILIVKTDSNGVMQWSERIQSQLDDEAYWIIADTDSTYLLCGNSFDNTNGKLDVFVIKMDLTGNVLSQKLYHSYEAERVASQIKTKDGGSIITGETLFNGSDLQIYMLKLDSANDIEWSRAYGDQDQEYGTFGIQTHDGGYVATGVARINSFSSSICLIKADSSGNLMWGKKFNTNPGYTKCLASRVLETADHGLVIAGSTIDSVAPPSYFVMKVDSNGTLLWQNIYADSSAGYVYDAINDSAGVTILGSSTDNNTYDDDIVLFNVDDNGNMTWQLGYKMPDSSMTASSLYKTDDGKYMISGVTDATQFGNPHVVLIKTDKVNDGTLCFQINPGLVQSATHLAGMGIDTFMVDTSTSIAGNFVLASGVQEDSICFYSPVKVPEIISNNARLFEDANGNIVFYPNGLSANAIDIYDMQGKLIRQINLSRKSTEVVLTKDERTQEKINNGIFIFRIRSGQKMQSVKLLLND
jgi:hypothetical protein